MIARALAIARQQRVTKCVMVLFPTRFPNVGIWKKYMMSNVHIRFADEHSGLKCLPVDVLITVGVVDPEGYKLAVERTRACSDPKFITVRE